MSIFYRSALYTMRMLDKIKINKIFLNHQYFHNTSKVTNKTWNDKMSNFSFLHIPNFEAPVTDIPSWGPSMKWQMSSPHTVRQLEVDFKWVQGSPPPLIPWRHHRRGDVVGITTQEIRSRSHVTIRVVIMLLDNGVCEDFDGLVLNLTANGDSVIT